MEWNPRGSPGIDPLDLSQLLAGQIRLSGLAICLDQDRVSRRSARGKGHGPTEGLHRLQRVPLLEQYLTQERERAWIVLHEIDGSRKRVPGINGRGRFRRGRSASSPRQQGDGF